MNCRGDDDIDAKRSRPSIGKPVIGPREERARAVDWDRSADHIRASGHIGCIAWRHASKRKQAGYMAAPERFAKKSDFSLAPRAPSIHGPNPLFAATQPDVCNGGQTGQSAGDARTAAVDVVDGARSRHRSVP